MRYLGIDYGSKKIGLALSDEAGTMGFPHAVVPRAGAEARVLELIKKEKVGRIVMGESRDLSGGENPIAEAARAFATTVAGAAGVPLAFESEVFTSAEARRPPEQEAKSRAPKVHTDVDASAAALILTSYLSRHDHA